MAIRRLKTEQEVEDQGNLGLFGALTEQPVTVEELQQIVAPTPTPEPTPAPATSYTWTGQGGVGGGADALGTQAPKSLYESAVLPFLSQGVQNIGGTIYQPQFESVQLGHGEEGGMYGQGALQNVLRYKEGQTAPGQTYEILDPLTGQITGTGKFKEQSRGFFGDLFGMVRTAAEDLGPLATFALGVGPLGGMLGGSIASTLGIPVAASAGAAGLSAAQVAALGSAAGSAGIGLAQGKDLGEVLEGAAKSVLPGLISTGINLPDYQIPGVREIVGNAFPDFVNDAIVRGAQDLASATVKSVITGQDLNVVNPLLPSVVSGITDATGLPAPVVQVGIQSLLGGELTPEGIFKTIVQNAPKIPSGIKAEGEDIDVVDTTLPTETDVAEEPTSLFPEFDQPLLTQEPTPEPTPAPTELPPVDIVQQLQQAGLEELLPELLPEPTARPITELEQALFQEANVMPEAPQQVVTTAEKETPALPELPAQPTEQDVQDYIQSILARYPEATPAPQQVEVSAPAPAPTVQDFIDQIAREEEVYAIPQYEPAQQVEIKQALPTPDPVQDYIQSIINAEAALPPDQTVVTTGNLPEQTLYELPEAPVMQDLYQPPGQLEGPSTIETTGTKLPEVPVIPLEDVPEVIAPPVEAPTIPAPTPTAPPAAAPAAPPAAPTPAPAPKRQDDLALLMLLAAMMTPQQEEEEKYQLAQILGVDSPFGRIV